MRDRTFHPTGKAGMVSTARLCHKSAVIPPDESAELSPAEAHTLRIQQLFVKHQGRLKSFTLTILPDFSAADDVLQEAFLVVTRKAADFQEGTNFWAWARRIVALTVIGYRRRQVRAPLALSDEVIEALAAAAPLETEEKHGALVAVLRQCLGRLSPYARELIRLRYFGEHGPQEIATLRDQSVNAVSVGLAKARTALRQCMTRQLRQKELSAS